MSEKIAPALLALGARAVLMKGGHLEGDRLAAPEFAHDLDVPDHGSLIIWRSVLGATIRRNWSFRVRNISFALCRW